MSQTAAVPLATAGPITDEILMRGIAAARQAQDGTLGDEAGMLLLMVAAPIMEECLQWRRKAGLIAELALPDNVVMLGGARG